MVRYGKKTKLDPRQVLKRADRFFGSSGLGLETQDRGPACGRWTGGGGFVSISTCQGAEGTEVDLQAREWEIQARDFVTRL
jgi:hypothetical protein